MKIVDVKAMDYDHTEICKKLEKINAIQTKKTQRYTGAGYSEYALFQNRTVPTIFMWWKKTYCWNPASEPFRVTNIKDEDFE